MTDTPQDRRPRWGSRRWRRRWRWAVLALLGPPLFYGMFVLVGMWPVNRGYVASPDGVAIYVASSPVHTDLVMPIRNTEWDWSEHFPASEFASNTDWATHYAIGWGDRGFYLDTPTWADLRASTAAKALLWPSRTVIHVQATINPARRPSLERIDLSPEQYRELCQAILESIDDNTAAIPGQAYSNDDAFYPARGAYHAFFTCNSWAGERLKQAGVCVPMWTPLPGSTTWYVEPAAGEP